MWRGDILVTDIEELEILNTIEVHARTLNAKEVLMPKNGEEFVLSSQMDESSRQEDIKVSEHPPQIRITLHEARSTTMFFKESRTVLSH